MANSTTFPVYILEFDGENQIVFPDDRSDIPHTQFWENVVAPVAARKFRVSVAELCNLPYCQRRARIVVTDDAAIAYYGEKQSAELLRQLAVATGLPNLKWRHDEHECRLDLDVAEFNQRCPE